MMTTNFTDDFMQRVVNPAAAAEAERPRMVVADDTEHSMLGASGAARWSVCPISINAPASDTTSEPAAKGTLGHHIAYQALIGQPYPIPGTVAEVKGYEFTVDEEFLRDIAAYVDWVKSRPWASPYQAETRVNYSTYLGVPATAAFGTSDLCGFAQNPSAPGGQELIVADLKMGHVAVMAAKNPQLTLYAAGVISANEPAFYLPNEMWVKFVVFQPPLSHRPYEWHTTVGWVRQQAHAMRGAAQAAIMYRAGTDTAEDRVQWPETPGSHCKYCKRQPTCREFQAALDQAGRLGKANDKWNPVVWGMRDAIINYIDGLKERALAEALNGNVLEGTKLVKGRNGSAALVMPIAQVKELATRYNVLNSVARVEEVIATPAKIRDAFKAAGMPLEELRNIVVSPEGKPAIANADDPRPAYQKPDDLSAFAL
jgi:Protein of unknown function (DUF2800)